MKKHLIPAIMVSLLILGTLSTVSADPVKIQVTNFEVVNNYNTPSGSTEGFLITVNVKHNETGMGNLMVLDGPNIFKDLCVACQNDYVIMHDGDKFFLPYDAQPGTTYYLKAYTWGKITDTAETVSLY